MELQACLDTGELNRRLRGTTKGPTGAAREMTVGDIGKPETTRDALPRGIDQSIGTRPRWQANACHRADRSDVYEVSKKVHREANSAAARGTPILIGPPQRGQFQV